MGGAVQSRGLAQEFLKALEEQGVLEEGCHGVDEHGDGSLPALDGLDAEHERADGDRAAEQASGHPEQDEPGDQKADEEAGGFACEDVTAPGDALLLEFGACGGEARAAELAMAVEADLFSAGIVSHDGVKVGGLAFERGEALAPVVEAAGAVELEKEDRQGGEGEEDGEQGTETRENGQHAGDSGDAVKDLAETGEDACGT